VPGGNAGLLNVFGSCCRAFHRLPVMLRS